MPITTRVRRTTGVEQVRAEIDAFEAFGERVRKIPPRNVRPGSGTDGTTVAVTARTGSSAFAAVREAYRDTVLSVEHWESAYGERTVEESLANEFSEELAWTLTDPAGIAFSPVLVDRLLRETVQAVSIRHTILSILEEEYAQLDWLADELGSLYEQLDAIEDPAERFDDRVDRIDAAERSLDELTRKHQSYLHERGLEIDWPFTATVYSDLDTHYPGLSAIATLRSTLDDYECRLWAGCF